ncbi:MAG: hypothetical protein QXL94_01990 [Candidatus Parvarchaeum sp.]
MWMNIILYSGEVIRMNLMSAVGGFFRGVDANGNDVVINKNEVQNFIQTYGNNDYYGYDEESGGTVGIGYG